MLDAEQSRAQRGLNIWFSRALLEMVRCMRRMVLCMPPPETAELHMSIAIWLPTRHDVDYRAPNTHTHILCMYVCMYVSVHIYVRINIYVCICERGMMLIIGPFISRYKLLWSMLNVTREEIFICPFFF